MKYCVLILSCFVYCCSCNNTFTDPELEELCTAYEEQYQSLHNKYRIELEQSKLLYKNAEPDRLKFIQKIAQYSINNDSILNTKTRLPKERIDSIRHSYKELVTLIKKHHYRYSLKKHFQQFPLFSKTDTWFEQYLKIKQSNLYLEKAFVLSSYHYNYACGIQFPEPILVNQEIISDSVYYSFLYTHLITNATDITSIKTIYLTLNNEPNNQPLRIVKENGFYFLRGDNLIRGNYEWKGQIDLINSRTEDVEFKFVIL